MSDPYVITVEFRLHRASDMAAFRTLIDANAQQSCALEPGCQRFDVLMPKGASDTILLYEIYDSRTAFEAHLRAAHFHVFDRESDPLVRSKSVSEFTLACEGSQTQTR